MYHYQDVFSYPSVENDHNVFLFFMWLWRGVDMYDTSHQPPKEVEAEAPSTASIGLVTRTSSSVTKKSAFFMIEEENMGNQSSKKQKYV